nr:MAG TPA: hypothetical protein [Caudoviricetes sp.]
MTRHQHAHNTTKQYYTQTRHRATRETSPKP